MGKLEIIKKKREIKIKHDLGLTPERVLIFPISAHLRFSGMPYRKSVFSKKMKLNNSPIDNG